jgi:hypothetical protein
MSFIDDLNERYFGGALSAEVVRWLRPIDEERLEARQFVERMFRNLHRQRLPATDFAELLAWGVGSVLPKILPGAWGAVPPITQQGRHSAIDEYLAGNPWRAPRDGERMLDLGCGFPPVTTLDTAERFPALRIVGADPSLGEYLVRESNGDYAIFDGEGTLLYFQAGMMSAAAWQALYRDPAETRARFSARLHRLLEKLGSETREGAMQSQQVTLDGVTLVRHPIAQFERANVSFTAKGIGAAGLSGFAVARCFNVLFYFDDVFRQQALRWLTGTLIEGGISIIGADWSGSRYARYSVHRSEGGKMIAREFAFSIENIRPLGIVPMFTLHDDDQDVSLMSSLIATLRDDEHFRADVDRRLDEIQADLQICPRKPDGYLGTISATADPAAVNASTETIGSTLEREGFAERAVDVLKRRGYRAWVNVIGHIAIDPNVLPEADKLI